MEDEDINEKEQLRRNRRKLKVFIDAAGREARRLGEYGYTVVYCGKFRIWEIRAGLYDEWLTLTTYVMALPPPGAVRAALLERIAELNDTMSIAKFAKSDDALTISLQYREEHLDGAVLRELLSLLYTLCEENYAELFRIASGVATLVALEQAFQRTSLPG